MTYRYNNKQRVIMLGHSMGSPVLNYFYHHYVTQEWKDQYIEAHVSMAGAWGGSTQIVELYAYGMQRTMSSSALLFPSEKLWRSDEILAASGTKNYTFSNLEEFFEDIDYPIGYVHYGVMKDALVMDPPGVKVHCLYGDGVGTAETFEWLNGGFPDAKPTYVLGDGDGTVNIRSLKVCGSWNEQNNNGYEVKLYNFAGIDHMGILKTDEAIETLKHILYPENTKS